MHIKHFSNQKKIWITLGILTLIIRYTASPTNIERFYSRGLFLWIRRIIDYSIGCLPFPLIYLFFLVLFFWIIWKIKTTVWRDFFRRQQLMNHGLSLFAFLGAILFFFFFLWGFNYGRTPFSSQLALDVQPVSIVEIKTALEKATKEIQFIRSKIAGEQVGALDKAFLPNDMENLVRESVKTILQRLNYPTVGNVRGRLLSKGIFLRFGTAGLYWPFVGEGNIDGGLHELQQPFTLAHELSHGYGITNEGVCNFIAYLACQNSDNEFIRYSGSLSYWRYLAGAYQSLQTKEYLAFRATLPKGLQADLDAINNTLAKYPDIMPSFRNYAYDQYLRSQGISEGMASYSQIIMLVHAWEKKLREGK